MTVEELTAVITWLSRDEVLVLVEAIQARLGLRDGPDDWGGVAALYGGPPREHGDSACNEPHALVLREVGRFRELVIARVRAGLSVPMAAAKAVVDAAPGEIARYPDHGGAYCLASALREVGATVEVRRIE